MRRAPLQHIALLCLAGGIVWLLGGDADGPSPALAQQQNFFTSSPGPLTTEHAELDNQDRCEDCHVNGSKQLSNDKCLGCHDHDNLKKRIAAGQGYHSSGAVRGRKCETCHVEHKKRGFDIMGWRTIKGGEKGFNHELTGWKLRDKHSVLECAECHKDKNKGGRRTYLGEDRECGSCHKDDDPHEFDRRNMMRCERCHTEVAWKPRKERLDFDHNNKADAEFPQEGAHADVACGKCHPKSKFNLKRKRPGNCGNSGCHVSSHEGHLFDKKACDWCHSPVFRSLKRFDFNHAARTRFSLAGAHGKQTCYKCHTKQLGTRKPERALRRLPRRRQQAPRSLRPVRPPAAVLRDVPPGVELEADPLQPRPADQVQAAGQARDHPVPLVPPRQGAVPVGAVRRQDEPRAALHELPRAHQRAQRRVHRQAEGPADLPAQRQGGARAGADLPRVPLQAGHGRSDPRGGRAHPRGARPLAAQVRARAGQVREVPHRQPVQGHAQAVRREVPRGLAAPGHPRRPVRQVPRRGPLGGGAASITTATTPTGRSTACTARCRSATTATRAASTPTRRATARRSGCHAKDDAHRGKLGDKCGKCHLETGQNVFNHNTQADYKLEGAHLKTRCAECHPSITFKPRPKDCFGGGACHAEPDVHKGQYGTVCETCHTTASFKDVQPQHDVGDFSLKGQHDNLPCKRCHQDNRPLAGTGNFCINCHRQDDIHSNSLSPRCGECHSQWSFAPGPLRSHDGGLQPDRPAQDLALLRLPQDREPSAACRPTATAATRPTCRPRATSRRWQGR